jgi:ABC-type antimicrobial peptide transport system permease subunit
MQGLASRRLRTPRFHALLILTFSATALLLAAIGTYGLFAYLISRRTRELGIRIALGAERALIVRSVLADGLRLAIFGVAIGTVSSILLVQGARSLIAGVSTFDPASLFGGAAILLVVATAACLAPALRASRVDPAVTLAAE